MVSGNLSGREALHGSVMTRSLTPEGAATSRGAPRSLFGSIPDMYWCVRSAVCIAIIMVLGLSVPDAVTAAEGKAQTTVTDSMVKALIVAIQDEIYINGYEKAYIDVDPERVPLYV